MILCSKGHQEDISLKNVLDFYEFLGDICILQKEISDKFNTDIKESISYLDKETQSVTCSRLSLYMKSNDEFNKKIVEHSELSDIRILLNLITNMNKKRGNCNR